MSEDKKADKKLAAKKAKLAARNKVVTVKVVVEKLKFGGKTYEKGASIKCKAYQAENLKEVHGLVE